MKALLIAVLILISSAQARAGELSEMEFRSICKIAQTIKTRYPLERYAYVGLGRSPTPFTAYLKTIQGAVVSNLPLSNFRYGANEWVKGLSSQAKQQFGN